MTEPRAFAYQCVVVLGMAFGALVLARAASSNAAPLPSDWQHAQQLEVAAPGLVKLSLPTATLDAARPALEDLRLYDDAGQEVPYLVERPKPAPKPVRDAKTFQVTVNAATTVLTLETGLAQPLDGITLETPATSFLKAVRIEGSTDGEHWQMLAQGQPIFRQSNGASQMRLAVPTGAWPWLRLTVDDRRSQPIPFTGARVHASAVESVPAEVKALSLAGRDENPGASRLTLKLGAANLDVASIQIETAEPLFTRQVTLAVPQVAEDAIREVPVAQGVIYRVAIEGQPACSNLTVQVDGAIHSRELLLLIRNQDSPPLPVTAVRIERRPVYLVFWARAAGPYHLLTGNPRCPAPSYDLAALGANLKNVAASPQQLSSLAVNPAYRAPEVLAGVQNGGTALDVAAWKYRKPVKLSRAGAQRIELDLDVLAHAQPGFGDLRLVSAGKQLPYVLAPTSISRSLTPTVTAAADKKDPRISRWIIKLPRPGLPVTRLHCTTRTPLFQRDVSLYEEPTDDRGDKYRHTLASASWTQTPERTSREFILGFHSSPRSDTLVLETHNGDNPAVELEKFQVFYPATRVLFKAQPADELLLYYGNPQASAPRYDLSLVAGQLLAADQADAGLAAEEQLKKSWGEGSQPGKGGVVFWGILAMVVVALLVIISRLVPRSAPGQSEGPSPGTDVK
ncbi:MAG TPA: DUF3999 family protein [Verrucomicrobiota bacterium]|nr:DUF3999 family protein [Verrucomicrobiota bacterium]HQL78011.1 DUF3999 family protein [Verrucomicrobiota bacterium]